MRQRTLQNAMALRSVCLLLAVSFVLQPSRSNAAVNIRSLIRKIGKIADDVPLNKADDIVEDAVTSRRGREIIEEAGGKIDDAVGRRRTLSRLLREAVGDADPSLLRQLEGLDEATQEAVLVLARGSKTIREGIPDVALRSRFLKEGGSETISAIGRHPDLMGDAIDFHAALRRGAIKPPPGMNPITMDQFGNFFRSEGPRAHTFWTKYVRPHWKLWLTGTALTAVLLAPDEFINKAGDVIEGAIDKLAKFGGDILATVIKEVSKGIANTTKDALEAAAEGAGNVFFGDIWGVATLIIVVVFVLLLIRPTRNLLLTGLKRHRPEHTPDSDDAQNPREPRPDKITGEEQLAQRPGNDKPAAVIGKATAVTDSKAGVERNCEDDPLAAESQQRIAEDQEEPGRAGDVVEPPRTQSATSDGQPDLNTTGEAVTGPPVAIEKQHGPGDDPDSTKDLPNDQLPVGASDV